MIARLCGLAIDARVQRREDLRAAAKTSRWVAANALALRGRRLFACGALPEAPWCAQLRITRFGELLAGLAMTPSLLATEELPARWRFALRVLGVPVLDELTSTALDRGICVVTLAAAPWTIEVEQQDRAYVARATRRPQLLAA